MTTGIITDGYLVAQKRKVAALGLEQLVDYVVYSDEFGRDHWKPSSVPYLIMMKMTGCTGPDCSYVSDNPLKDFVTAKAQAGPQSGSVVMEASIRRSLWTLLTLCIMRFPPWTIWRRSWSSNLAHYPPHRDDPRVRLTLWNCLVDQPSPLTPRLLFLDDAPDGAPRRS